MPSLRMHVSAAKRYSHSQTSPWELGTASQGAGTHHAQVGLQGMRTQLLGALSRSVASANEPRNHSVAVSSRTGTGSATHHGLSKEEPPQIREREEEKNKMKKAFLALILPAAVQAAVEYDNSSNILDRSCCSAVALIWRLGMRSFLWERHDWRRRRRYNCG